MCCSKMRRRGGRVGDVGLNRCGFARWWLVSARRGLIRRGLVRFGLCGRFGCFVAWWFGCRREVG